MAKRISQLSQLTAAQLAALDIVPIVDISAGTTKYITVQDLTGLPDVGWIATGEAWSYSSYNSTTKVGVITVPTDATTKYSKGMWIRISQATGGTKHGVITALTATTLTITFLGLHTLNNEAISSPVYSPLAQPYGAPTLPVQYTDANGWTVWDFGAYRGYFKRVTFSQTIGGLVVLTISSSLLPSDLSSIGSNSFSYSYTTTSNAGRLLIVFEGNSASTFLNFTTATTDTASTAFVGAIDVKIGY